MTTHDLAARVREFLKRRGEPASSLLLAERFLRSVARSEALATALLRPLLREAGALYEPEIGWRLGEPDGAGDVPADAALSRLSGASSVRRDLGPARTSEAATEPERRVACAVVPGRGRRGAGRICLMEIPAAGRAPGKEREARPLQRVERRDPAAISRLLRGAEAIFTDPRREAPSLLEDLARRGLPGPARVRSLVSAVRGPVRLPRGSGPERIAEILDCPYLEEDDPRAAATNIVTLVRKAEELRGPGEGPGRRPSAAEDPERRLPTALSKSFLETVPSKPGVYSFHDESGGLLYVGKAANLRRRLSSHASAEAASRASSGRRPPFDRGRVRRVRYRVLGSDLEALLEEARLIATRSPSANVQRRVHERGRRYAAGRTWALLLPSKSPPAMAALFVRDGSFAGLCRIGPRGGGAPEAMRILRRLLRTSRRGRCGSGGERSGPRADPDRDQRGEIVTSWLARYGERFSRVDLDACTGPASACRLLTQAIREEAKGSSEVAHHRPSSSMRGRRRRGGGRQESRGSSLR